LTDGKGRNNAITPCQTFSLIRTLTVGMGISPNQPHMRVADFNCR